MSLFKKQATYYLSVCFLHSQRAYTYKTTDHRITVNDVVLVPVVDEGELKPAIISRVETEPPPWFPPRKNQICKRPRPAQGPRVVCGSRYAHASGHFRYSEEDPFRSDR